MVVCFGFARLPGVLIRVRSVTGQARAQLLALSDSIAADRATARGLSGGGVGGMPPFRPYSLKPGQTLELEVVQPDGGRALVCPKTAALPLM